MKPAREDSEEMRDSVPVSEGRCDPQVLHKFAAAGIAVQADCDGGVVFDAG